MSDDETFEERRGNAPPCGVHKERIKNNRSAIDQLGVSVWGGQGEDGLEKTVVRHDGLIESNGDKITSIKNIMWATNIPILLGVLGMLAKMLFFEGVNK